MTFHMRDGRVTVDDPATGERVFDSDEKMFTGLIYTGSVSLPARSNSASASAATNINRDIVLHTGLPPEFDTVIGAFRTSGPDGDGVNNIGWFAATGTYLRAYGAEGRLNRPTERAWLAHLAAYTFRAQSGTLYLNERVVLKANNSRTITLQPFTMQYRIYAGTFV